MIHQYIKFHLTLSLLILSTIFYGATAQNPQVFTTVSGIVWVEADNNSMYNGEPLANGVTVELQEISFTIPPPTTTTTTVNGVFTFNNVDPGQYRLVIPASQFGNAQPLMGLASCSGSNNANDGIDNDDNGSNTTPGDVFTDSFILTNDSNTNPANINYIDFCFTTSDCAEENPFSSAECNLIAPSDVICDINVIDDFCYTMPELNNNGNQPEELCEGSSIENISWIAFVAWGGSYTININTLDCTSGISGESGIQVGVYGDCSFTDEIFCSPSCSSNQISISSQLLVEGETYYLYIDGCKGSICSYEMDIIGSPTSPSLSPSAFGAYSNNILVTDSLEYCDDALISFEAQNLDITATFTWKINLLSGGPYSGDTLFTTNDNEFSTTFFNDGRYEVCLIEVDNNCFVNTDTLCVLVDISGSVPRVEDEVFTDQFLCFEDEGSFDITLLDNQDPNGDGTFGWEGPIVDFTQGTYDAIVQSPGCSYTQSFELDIYAENSTENIFVAVCSSDLPTTIEGVLITTDLFVGGSSLYEIDNVISNIPDENGCERTVNLTVRMLDVVDGFINPPECVFNGVIVDFDYDVNASTNSVFLDFVWTTPNGQILFPEVGATDPTTINILDFNPSGTYTLTVTAARDGISCDFVYTVFIDFESFTISTPSLSGLTQVCAGSSVTYTATGGDATIDYIWTFPSDVAGVSYGGILDNMLTIDWTGSNGGVVSVQSENGCNISAPASSTITILSTANPSFSLPSDLCVGETTTISGTQGFGVYQWEFGDATILDGGFGVGPHTLQWTTAGTKTITLQAIGSNGCSSEIISQNVFIEAPMQPTVLSCSPSVNDILFTWTPVSGVSYNVEVTSGQFGSFEGDGLYRVAGLFATEEVEITLIATDFGSSCSDPVNSSLSCIAQDCPPTVISLSTEIITFCDNFPGVVNINANVATDNTGSGSFSGPGIVDPIGTFDPKQANIGSNVITYNYVADNGCNAMQTITMQVIASPVASFSSGASALCTEDVTLTYNGSAGVDTYNWTVDGQTIPDVPNPTISFDTPGVKTISLQVSTGECQSEIITQEITIVAPTASFSTNTASVCVSESVILTYNGSAGVDTYNWTVDGQTIPDVPNPTISFDTPGVKIISLQVSTGECQSETITQEITVDSELADLILTCTESEGSILFDWNDVQGASSYLININGVTQFNSNNSITNVSGLGSEEEVTLQITAISDGACDNVTATITCTSRVIVSVEDATSDPVILYPNPVSNILYVDGISDGTAYQIYDIQGRVVSKGIYNQTIDTQSLNEGIYILKLIEGTNTKVIVKKFVKR